MARGASERGKRARRGPGEGSLRSTRQRAPDDEKTTGLLDLPTVLMDAVLKCLTPDGGRVAQDDIAAMRCTCKAWRAAFEPWSDGGHDRITPRGATLSRKRLLWAVAQVGIPADERDQRALFAAAASAGRVEVLEELKERGCLWVAPPHGLSMMKSCAFGGHVAALKWLSSQRGAAQYGAAVMNECAVCACLGGHLGVLEWLRDDRHLTEFDYDSAAAAAGAGRLDVLKWLRANGGMFGFEPIEAVAERGHLDVLKWLKRRSSFSAALVARGAARGGRVEVLEWLWRENQETLGFSWVGDEELAAQACEQGHVGVLEFLVQRSDRVRALELDGIMMLVLAAVKGEQISSLEWIKEHPTCANPDHANFMRATYTACLEGAWKSLRVAQWFRREGADWCETFCATAAEHGNFEMLKWARIDGAPWDERVCKAAVNNNNMEMLQWARMYGAPWTLSTRRVASKMGYVE